MLLLINWIIVAFLGARVVAQDPDINCAADATTSNHEGAVRKHLLCNYDSDYLPVKEIGPVAVNISMFRVGVDFDDFLDTVTCSTFIQMSWNDHHLQWNPDDYRQVMSIEANSDHIWHPNLALHNNDVSGAETELCPAAQCTVLHSGEVSCNFLCKLSASCHGNYRWWPYDKQECTLTFGGWIYKHDEVHFVVDSYDYQYEGHNGEDTQSKKWRITREATINPLHNDGANTSTTTTTFRHSFEMRRHATMEALVMITPAAAIALINVLSLWLAPDCVERLGLICFNVFFQFMYLTEMAGYVPKNGPETPVLVIIFKTSLWITVLLEVSAIIARGLRQLNSKPPQWLMLGFAKVAGRSYFESDYLLKAEAVADGIEQADVPSTANPEWTSIVRSFDRVLFVFVALIYTILIITVLVLTL